MDASPSTPSPAWHALPADSALAELRSTAAGLTAAETADRQRRYGPNIISMARPEGLLVLIWRQINNPISWVLVVAGFLALGLRKWTDAMVVFGAVVINAAIGFVQELKAGRAIASLGQMVPELATVLRDGQPHSVPAASLVPGDVVTLAGGDKIPADLRLLAVKNFHTDEAALTGESLPVAKRTAAAAADAVLGDRTCMAYGGTLAVQGTATGLVVGTGADTELGRISALLNQTTRMETPLTRQLASVSKWITVAILAVTVLLMIYGVVVKHAPLGEALLVGITLAVAAMPEGLPAIISIALAIGVRRMAERRAVVRHLPAVETLGSTSVICSDKTGTLTRNEMTVVALWAENHEYRLSGTGYSPEGALEHDGQALAEPPAFLHRLMLAAGLCNDAALKSDADDNWTLVGDPTEGALLTAARKMGFDETRHRREFPRLDVIPFESDTKFMGTLHRLSDSEAVLLLKGAPDVLAPRCGLKPEEEQRLTAAMNTLAAQGMRVLALAEKSLPATAAHVTPEDAAGGLRFLGLMGMIDPPRTEAMDAIRTCHQAGIIVKMITGDHQVTAEAIGRQLGLAAKTGGALTGRQLDALDEAGLQRAARDTNVFARVAPEHKIKLVRVLQEQGHVVAMTGDGVNDAPALKRADIGVAMGITGTSVSKEAAKVVLMDDNFATIAAAVEEGRRVYDNLLKALAFILPTNLALAMILAGGMLFFPTAVGGLLLLPMSPTQILWINLVASVALSLPMALEVLEPGAMRRPPRRRNEPIMGTFMLARTIGAALLMAAGACLLFLWEYYRIEPRAGHPEALAQAQTMCVTTVTLFQSFYLLHCRSLRGSLGASGWFSNPSVYGGIGLLLLLQCAFMYLPVMRTLFGTSPLDAMAWLDSTLVAVTIIPVISLEKWLRNRRDAKATPVSPSSGG
ncbi:MAG: HAD-IC family P-type ATPase [Lentisphaeria bacterium]